MKRNIRTLFIPALLFFFCACTNNTANKKVFNRQLGTYRLDVRRTALGVYAVDAARYEKLYITFYPDSTFVMTMKVPFMYDNYGTWVAGDGSPYSFNQLFFQSFSYSKEGMGEQFYPPYPNDGDTIFLMNSITPQKGFSAIKEIYFVKTGR